ncbi:MAG: VWD domain-containing protein [Pseudomonadota bacterium]
MPARADGLAIGIDFEACRATGAADADRDGISDTCEYQLAKAFAPQLVFSGDEKDGGRDRVEHWAVSPLPDGSVRIVYALEYLEDNGFPGLWDNFSHQGDAETISVDVQSNGGGNWSTTGLWLSAHHNGPLGVFGDCSKSHNAADLGAESWTTVPGGAPVVYVSAGKHANYATLADCRCFDTCDDHGGQGLVKVDEKKNLGSVDYPLIDCIDCDRHGDPCQNGSDGCNRVCFWQEQTNCGCQDGKSKCVSASEGYRSTLEELLVAPLVAACDRLLKANCTDPHRIAQCLNTKQLIAKYSEGVSPRESNAFCYRLLSDMDKHSGFPEPNKVPAAPRNGAGSRGDPHLVTFDGVRYDCQPHGEVTLVRDERDGLEVQARTLPFNHSNVSVNVAAAARVGSDKVAFYLDGTTTYNGASTVFLPGKNMLSSGSVFKNGNQYIVVWADNTQVHVSNGGSYLGIDVYVPDERQAHLHGLFGNFDQLPTDELVTKAGDALTEPVQFDDFYFRYVESWRVTDENSLFVYPSGKHTADFTDRAFPHALVAAASLASDQQQAAALVCVPPVPPIWLDACVMDVGTSSDPSFATAFNDAPAPRTAIEILPPSPPAISAIYPQSVVAGGTFTVIGSHLAPLSDPSKEVTVNIADASGTTSVALPIVRGSADQLTIGVPSGLNTTLPGPNLVSVSTPYGTASTGPVFVVADNGFGGSGSGGGLIGAVYRLVRGTSQFPTAGDTYSLTAPCASSTITTAKAGELCPLTTIGAANLDVPARSFTQGFPGLDPTLNEYFAIRFRGYLTVDTAGTYTIESCSDDGSNVYLANVTDPTDSTQPPPSLTRVVANDGLHAMQCVGGKVTLPTVGAYRLVVDYIQGPGANVGLQLVWTPPGQARAIVPSAQLKPFL